MGGLMKALTYQIMIFIILFFYACNPVSENIEEKTWDSLHSSKPFMSNIYHGAEYRFPKGACDEPQCHGSDLNGGNSGALSCYVCHTDVWTIFSTTHTKNFGGYYHDSNIDQDYNTESTSTWYSSCKNPAERRSSSPSQSQSTGTYCH